MREKELIVNSTEFGISVGCIEDGHLAIAEVSIVDQDSNTGKLIAYFNRISVPSKIRNNKIGTKILKRLLETAKIRNIAIMNEINPYGDLNYKQLKEWYIKHGFKESSDGLMWYNK